MAKFEFKLPDLGEGVVEGEIVAWHVKPGDAVIEDQELLELMTDKATVTVPSPKTGTVLKTYGTVGEMAKVHFPLVDLEITEKPLTAQSVQIDVLPIKPLPVVQHAKSEMARKLLATPVTRRMASAHNVDLLEVLATGPQGRVLKADVEAFLATRDVTVSAKPIKTSETVDRRIPLRGVRKKIAEKMVKSKFTAPHYTFVEEVDVNELVELRAKLNAQLQSKGSKLSFLPFFVKAVTSAFVRFPEVNAIMDEVAQELIVRGEMNIGIATMTEQGLMVPVVKHAHCHGLEDLSREIHRLATAARAHKIQHDELSGSTFTITSLGESGGLFATPIINHPEVAIMGVHRMRKRPVVMDDEKITIRPVMNFSFCFDHRVIDGATGADFAYEVLKYIEHPELFMLAMH